MLEQSYFQGYRFAKLALEEALLRFPQAEQANPGSGCCIYLACLGDGSAGERYGNLIAQGLNSGELSIATLVEWFAEKEPDLKLSVAELKRLPGSLGSWLVQVSGAGGAFVWLEETRAVTSRMCWRTTLTSPTRRNIPALLQT